MGVRVDAVLDILSGRNWRTRHNGPRRGRHQQHWREHFRIIMSYSFPALNVWSSYSVKNNCTSSHQSVNLLTFVATAPSSGSSLLEMSLPTGGRSTIWLPGAD
ncbi:unnamed protein product [Lota lota]